MERSHLITRIHLNKPMTENVPHHLKDINLTIMGVNRAIT